MLIPESVLRDAPQFVLIRNFEPKSHADSSGAPDLALSEGEFVGCGKKLDELSELVSPASYRDALQWPPSSEFTFFSHAVVLLGHGDVESLVSFIAEGLLDMVHERVEHPTELDVRPLVADHRLLERPEEAARLMLRPSRQVPSASQQITGGDLWTLWEAFVYRVAWWSGHPPDNFIDKLVDCIDALPCGIHDGAWDELDEYLSK